jgi:transposase
MLPLPPSVRVYIATQPIDLRKSFDGLSAAVAARFGQDPLGGHMFVFWNRRRNQMRILFWDRTGYVIIGKKLARGRFYMAGDAAEGTAHVEVDAAELGLMLEGIDLAKSVRRKRWRSEPTSGACTRSEEAARLSVPRAEVTPRIG